MDGYFTFCDPNLSLSNLKTDSLLNTHFNSLFLGTGNYCETLRVLSELGTQRHVSTAEIYISI